MSHWRVVDVKKLDQVVLEKYRRRLSRELNSSDDALIDEVIALGFRPETAMLLPLVPLMQVAWADGQVSSGERERIRALAAKRGLFASPKAQDVLDDMLTFEPGQDFAEQCYSVLSRLFAAMPPEESVRTRRSLMSFAREVAMASGGFLGMFGDKVEQAELNLLVELAKRLDVPLPEVPDS